MDYERIVLGLIQISRGICALAGFLALLAYSVALAIGRLRSSPLSPAVRKRSMGVVCVLFLCAFALGIPLQDFKLFWAGIGLTAYYLYKHWRDVESGAIRSPGEPGDVSAGLRK